MTQAATTIDFSIPAMQMWEHLPEGTWAEVINEKLYILPLPTSYHSLLSARFLAELYMHVVPSGLGLVFNSRIAVFLKNGKNVVSPDVAVVLASNKLAVADRKGVHGPSDLHIEVLSPGNRKHDLVVKKKLYEEAGVKEYWMADPETKSAQGYLLQNGKYRDALVTNSEINIRVLGKTISF